MRTTQLDLGLALAAVARGFTVKRKDDPNISLEIVNGLIFLLKKKGKKARIEHTALWLDWDHKVWYIVGDDQTWLDKDVV